LLFHRLLKSIIGFMHFFWGIIWFYNLCYLRFNKPCYPERLALISHGYSINQGKRYYAPDVTRIQATYVKHTFLEGIWSFNVHESCSEERCEITGDKGKLCFSFFWNPVLEIHSGSGIEKIELPFRITYNSL